MTDQEFRQKIERAADWKTSGIQENPWLTQRVLTKIKEGERPMKKKLAFMPVLVFAIVAICAVALAATQLGLIATTADQYQHQDANHSANVQVPELSIQPESDETAAAQAKTAVSDINAEVAAIAKAYIDQFKTALDKNDYQDTIVEYEVLNETERYFTLRLMCYTASGSGAETDYYYTIDLQTGKRLALADLFKPDSDYLSAIAGSIAEQMKAQTAANPENTFWLDDEEMPDFDLAEMVKDADFFVNAQNEVVISFDEGDVAPMSSGMVQFTIPADVLADIRVAL